jgi:putative membrane protein
MKKILAVVFAMVLVVGLASFVSAQQKADGKVSDADKKFMMEAASGGMFEVEAGKVAAQKASAEDVKKFGQRMVDDHSKANEELMQLANSKGVTPPKEMNKAHKEKLDKLSKKSGKDFDKAYMDEMVKDHTKDVSAFKKEAKDGKDPDVKAWASKTLPTLEDHLKMAKDMSKSGRT